VCDWAQPLADDLAELGIALGIDMSGAQQALDAECARWAAAARRAEGGADPWIVEYSRLFLTPPVRVPLNTGLYLQGAIGGRASQMTRSCYESAGMRPDKRFRDLPDHVAMQLEFLARLFERAARGQADAAAMADEFAAEFVFGWGEPLERACAQAEAAAPAAQVYRSLARLVRVALGEPGLARS
jgi:TorA maturation chaperone TorD